MVAPEALGVAPEFVPSGPGEQYGHVDHVGDPARFARVLADELREPTEPGADGAGEPVDAVRPPHQVGLPGEPAPLEHAGGGGHPAVEVAAEASVLCEVAGALDHVARDPVTERHRLVVASARRQVLHDRPQDRGSRAHRAGADRLGVTVPPVPPVEQLIGVRRSIARRHRVIAVAVTPHRDARQSVDECVDPPAQAGALRGVGALLVAGHERHQAGALAPEFGHRRTRSLRGTGREVGLGYPAQPLLPLIRGDQFLEVDIDLASQIASGHVAGQHQRVDGAARAVAMVPVGVMTEYRRIELQPAVEIGGEAQRGVDVTRQRIEGELGAFRQVERSRPILRAWHAAHRTSRVDPGRATAGDIAGTV